MTPQLTVYLAGPEVFLANAEEIGREKKAMCREFGFVGLFPLDAELEATDRSFSVAAAIYQGNLRLLERADLIVANMTPFRGPSMDVGTAFEMGFMAARGKPVFGYTHNGQSYLARVREAKLAGETETVDRDGLAVEDFGLGDNLMMSCAVALSGELVVHEIVGAPARKSLADLVAFKECLRRAAAALNGHPQQRR